MAAKTSWHRYGTKSRQCHPVYILSPGQESAVLCDLSVRRSVFSATVSPKPLVQTSTKFSVRGRDWVHLWRRCNALYTSGFVNDVIFAVDGLYGAGDVGVSSK